jgi:alkylation response protein AidB-like acyl-CoA dehydrogenase
MLAATHAWLENVTYQLTKMDKKEAMLRLGAMRVTVVIRSISYGCYNTGGPIALLKAQSTQTMEFCAREASQIFGGLAYTRGGQGEKVERLYREVRAFAIPGGSEEIMLDLGIRQAEKQYAYYKAKM